VRGDGKTAHVDADLGDNHFRRSMLNAGDGFEVLNDLRERAQLVLDLLATFLDRLIEIIQVSKDTADQER
jgi:hypothetical protein